MPIARVKMPDGRIARFRVPDGMPQEEITKLALEQVPAKVGGEEVKKPVTGEFLKDASLWLERKEPGIDYSAGIDDFGFRAKLSRADNEQERINVLREAAGEGNFSKDTFGNYIIKPEGLKKFGIEADKPRAIDEEGRSLNDLADISGDIPAVLGGVGAATAATGMGAIPGMALTGLGTVAGRLIGEGAEQLAGENIQPAEEVLKSAGVEGLTAAAGEGLFRGVAAPIGRKILAPEAKRMTPESTQLMREAESIGAKPSVSQITKAPILGRAQAISDNIFGDPNAVQNAKAISNAMEDLSGRAGPRIGQRGAQGPMELLGANVQDDIAGARKALSTWANDAYTKVDELFGNQPIIPTQNLKVVAREYLQDFPTTEAGRKAFVPEGTIKTLNDVADLPDYITAAQMQRVRTQMFSAVDDKTLVPDIPSSVLRQLGKAASKSFQDAATADAPLETQVANQVLKSVNRKYATQIKRFDNNFIKRIANDPSGVGPDQIIQSAFKQGQSGNMKRIMNLLPKERQAEIRRVAMDDILKNMEKRTDDPMHLIFDGKGFLNSLDKVGKETLQATFGKEMTSDLYKLGRVTQFVTQRQKFSGGLIAAAIAADPIGNLGRLVKFNLLSRALNSKGVRKWLTTGFQAKNTREASAAITRALTQMNLLVDENLTAEEQAEQIQAFP